MAKSFQMGTDRSQTSVSPNVELPGRGGAHSFSWSASIVAANWHRLGLVGITGLSLFFNLWHIGQNGTGNSYYAAAVKSMTQSWHNFFFASFDPGGFITVDKPPVALWIQAGFAKVLGFSGFSLHLPQALAGTGAVLLVYLAVSRVFGKAAGLVAALVLSLTPITVAINRSNNLDAWLIFFTVAAAYAIVRAIQSGSLRWLLVSALMIGVAFNTKSLGGFVALPALWLAYLLTAPVSLRRRIRDLVAATAVLAFVSASWVVAVDLTPVSARPYVGGSQTNSELDLLLDYNGLGRIDGEGNGPGGMRGTPPQGGSFPDEGPPALPEGATLPEGMPVPPTGMFPGDDARVPPPDGPGFPAGPANGAPRMNRGGPGGFGGGQSGWLRLFGAELAGQASWLIPLGLIGGLAAMVSSRGPLAGNQRLGSIIVWGGWLLTAGAVFSLAKGIFHPYYLSYLGPAIGGMAGIAVAHFWSKLLVRSWLGFIAPLALIATAVVQVVFLRRVPDYETWLQPVIIGSVALAALVLVISKLRRLPSSVLAGALGLAVAALLLPAFLYTSSVLGSPGSSLPYVSPGGQAGGFAGGPPSGATRGGPNSAAPDQTNGGLIEYLLANRGEAKFIVATQSSMTASPIIIATGEPVMAVGGFSGGDPALTVSELADLVEAGQLRFFLVQGAGGGPGGSNGVIQAVTKAGKVIDASAYGGTSGGTLYDLQGSADVIRSQVGS